MNAPIRTHSHVARGLDAYFSPPEAVRALAGIEKLPRRIFDPACGDGAILNVLEGVGHQVSGADIVSYGWPETILKNFLAAPCDLRGVGGIITNPPYRLVNQFVEKVLADGAPYAAFLLRLSFLESLQRKPFFERTPPSRIWVSSRRLRLERTEGVIQRRVQLVRLGSEFGRSLPCQLVRSIGAITPLCRRVKRPQVSWAYRPTGAAHLCALHPSYTRNRRQ